MLKLGGEADYNVFHEAGFSIASLFQSKLYGLGDF